MKIINIFTSLVLFYPLKTFSLNYIESSQGLIPPNMEGGRTEIEMFDINRDGKLDLLSIGDHGSPYVNTDQHGIMVWFGDGRGNWNVYMNGNFGYGGLAVGDVNNDGFLDVGYGMHHNYSSNDFGDQVMEVALGDGTGRNWTPWDDSLGMDGQDWGMFETDFADVDNDGDLDVGSNSFGANDGIHIYLNLGNGTWRRSFGFIGGNSDMDFVFGDINKDGNVDFAAAHQYGSVYLGDGTGNFTLAHRNLPPISTFPYQGVALGDVDNDGGKDLGFVNLQGGVSVWLFSEAGDTWQNFSGNLPSTGNYDRIQLFDMNTDGYVDVIGQGRGTVRVWLGDGQGNWTEAVSFTTPNPGYGEAMRVGGDCDHNGFPDIVLVLEEGNWPNERNRCRFFKETSVPTDLTIKPIAPQGYERFEPGSVQFINWLTGIPNYDSSKIRLEFSSTGPQGPYEIITETLPNTGFYQWRIPNLLSNNCYIRYTVMTASDTAQAITSRPFSIGLPSGIAENKKSTGLIYQTKSLINATAATFILSEPAIVTLKIYDITGKEEKTIFNSKHFGIGSYQVGLKELNLSPGIYFLLFSTPNSRSTTKLIVTK